MRISLRRPLLGALALGLASSAVATPAQAANGPSKDAAGWLSRQLDDRSLVVSSWTDGSEWHEYIDHGLTLDLFFAFDDLGVRAPARAAIVDALESRVEDYVAPAGDTYAGAVAKLLTAVQTHGVDPATYADGGLLTRLEGLVVTEGPETGRAKDDYDPTSEWAGDTSNTIGQSWAVRALTSQDSELADEATEFLVAQQCAGGWFRVYMDSTDFTCESGTAGESSPSVDATAFAVHALQAAADAGITGLGDEIERALTWLVAQQRPNGSFREDGVANTNTTGVATAVLADQGLLGPAGNAASWLARHQVRAKHARGPLEGESGAVAFDKPMFDSAREVGVERADRYVWRRASAQAASGLDALLPRTRLAVRAPARAQRREVVRIKVKGLEAGERWTVRRGKKKVSSGWANRKGVAVTEVKLKKAGKVRIKAKGSRGVRAGADVVRVR